VLSLLLQLYIADPAYLDSNIIPPTIDMPYLDPIERKRLTINNMKLKGDTKNVKQAAIVDLDNSDIITILKFSYNILERSSLILNLAILYEELNIAKEHKIRNFKVTYRP
jgi:hypothetical protein